MQIEEVVTRAKTGDTEALADLYREFQPFVFNYIYKRVKNYTESEEITSKVFAKVIEKLDQYEYQTGAGFNRWLIRLTHNMMVDEWRKVKRLSYWPEIPESYFEAADSAEDDAFVQINHDAFEKYLEYCTPQQAEVIDMKYRKDLSNDQIAAILGMSIGAVKSMQHRAFDNIKEGMASEV